MIAFGFLLLLFATSQSLDFGFGFNFDLDPQNYYYFECETTAITWCMDALNMEMSLYSLEQFSQEEGIQFMSVYNLVDKA